MKIKDDGPHITVGETEVPVQTCSVAFLGNAAVALGIKSLENHGR